jgi:chromosomal replication initiator protein
MTGNAIHLNFVIDKHLRQEGQVPPVIEEPPGIPYAPVAASLPKESPVFLEQAEDTGLNPKYTFETYVVGESNRFAHAASLAVAEQPSRAYNPLFIYGGVGLGKTHLMHAIGHAVIQHSAPGLRLYYLSFERFMNELINAIRYDAMQHFRDKYRTIDLLLIDDIQFIAGKERTQEEFFHTFNALYDAHKQIIISSDCPPKKIPTLEERLRSRFEWGLIVDIQPPELETKIAILKKKAEIERAHLPDDVALYIATKIQSNIRALEGCLVKLIAHATLTNVPITVELVKRVLHDILDTEDAGGSKHDITVELIQDIVANHYQISRDDMTSSTRQRVIAFPRQIAMYLSRKLTDLSLPMIGQAFGGKDHTTIMHACQKIETLVKTDLTLSQEIQRLEERIGMK